MKYLFFLLFISSAFAHEGAFHLFSQELKGRKIHVYLPEEYDSGKKNYPVLYMHDGQNLYDSTRAFNGQTWNAQETLNKLILNKIIRPLIVVAIDNTSHRISDYTHDVDQLGRGGHGDEYLEFVVHELHPLIKKYLRISSGQSNTGILGSSLGGLISLYAGTKFPHVFGLIGAMSPSIWWNSGSILEIMNSASKLPTRLYLDSGTIGGENPDDVKKLYYLLRNRFASDSLLMVIKNGDDHSERAWSGRFDRALIHLFGKK
jgi:predicted alpha/beta superfamily hydrolase